MEWENQYIEALIKAIHPGGDVLQVGFATGYAAAQIQQYHPQNHVIIERDSAIAKEARKWASKHPTVKIIEDTWENALSQLGVFDSIFFNEPDSQIQHAVKENLFTSEVLNEGDQLLEEIGRQLPELTRIRYLDHELDAFCQSVGSSSGNQLSRFLADLEQNGQITVEQKKKMIRKYKLKETKGMKTQIGLGIFLDPMLVFLKECLNTHMRKGSRFTCFTTSSKSKSEDPLFSEEIIVNPYLHYQEMIFSPSKSSKKEALIILVEKLV